MTSRIIRVFPRRTKATPDDALAYVGPPDLFAEADEVHISVSFTWDKSEAERLAEQWRWVAPVKLGGVAYGDDSLEFIPGRYVKPGYDHITGLSASLLVLWCVEEVADA